MLDENQSYICDNGSVKLIIKCKPICALLCVIETISHHYEFTLSLGHIGHITAWVYFR